jgi:hypothetical protein
MPTRIQLANDLKQKMRAGATDNEMIAAMLDIKAKHGREMAIAVLELVEGEMNEYIEEEKRELADMEEIKKLFDELSAGTKLRKAAEIKARSGDSIAKALLVKLNSRQWRLNDALLTAALQAHPDWQEAEGSAYRYIGGGEPPDDWQPALIEWFQKNHPREARAIEIKIDAQIEGAP